MVLGEFVLLVHQETVNFSLIRKESYCGLGGVKAVSAFYRFLVHTLDVQLHSNMCLCMNIHVLGKNYLVREKRFGAGVNPCFHLKKCQHVSLCQCAVEAFHNSPLLWLTPTALLRQWLCCSLWRGTWETFT